MVSVEEAAAYVLEIVSRSAPIHGSEVAKALATRFSAWRVADMGVRSLREFISKHVPKVLILGRSGMDVLYGLQGTVLPAVPLMRASSSASSSAWRVWASPNSKSVLLVSKNTGALGVAPRDSQSDPALLRLDPPGSQVHEAMAKEFIEQLGPPLRERLATALTGAAWWVEWAKLLRGTTDEDSWLKVRRERLVAEFRTRIEQLEVPEPATTAALAWLSPPRTIPRPTSKPDDPALDHLRRLVREVALRMNAEDLRALKLPVGLVSDVLHDPRLKH